MKKILNKKCRKFFIQEIFNQTTSYFASKGIDVLSELKNVDFLSQFKEIPNLLNSVLGAVGSLSVGLFSVLFKSWVLSFHQVSTTF